MFLFSRQVAKRLRVMCDCGARKRFAMIFVNGGRKARRVERRSKSAAPHKLYDYTEVLILLFIAKSGKIRYFYGGNGGVQKHGKMVRDSSSRFAAGCFEAPDIA